MNLEKGTSFPLFGGQGYLKYIDHMGSDEAIIEAARMSTGKGFIDWDSVKECKKCKLRFPGHQPVSGWPCAGQTGPQTNDNDIHDWKIIPGDQQLLEFLYANKHMTPFEMGELCVEVQAPIMVFREWHRHRTQSYNEFSARYAMMPNEHYLPAKERIQKQSDVNKQGSGSSLEFDYATSVVDVLQIEQESIYARYEQLIRNGVAKEVARLNTPVSRMSKMRAKTDLRNFLSFCMLRSENHAQWEIRQCSDVILTIIQAIWPRTLALFMEHDFLSTRFSRTEMRLIQNILDQYERKTGMTAEELAPNNSWMPDEKKRAQFLIKLISHKDDEYSELLTKLGMKLGRT